MALPTVFGSLTSTSGSLALLDGNFNALGALVTNIGTVTGTNAYVFTSASNNPTISAYANFMRFGFVAGNTSTGASTFKVGSLAALKIFGADATTQITTGGIVANVYYELVYNSALDTGTGGFQIVNNQPSNLSTPVSVPNGGTGLTSITAYAVMCGGTTLTGSVQPVASVGTAGQVLTSNGAGALPSFQTAAAGDRVLLATLTASTSASLSDTTHLTNTYNWYEFDLIALIADTNLKGLLCEVSDDAGSTWKSASYVGGVAGQLPEAGTTNFYTPTANIRLTGVAATGYQPLNSSASIGVNGRLILLNPSQTARPKAVFGRIVYTEVSGGNFIWDLNQSYAGNNNAITGIRWRFESGNITSGVIKVYGVI